MKPLFTIENLVCSYNGVTPVLYIPQLTIPAGEICVLFGKSGSGKSTLLETLGVMTNTIAANPCPYRVIAEKEDVPALAGKSTTIRLHLNGDKVEPIVWGKVPDYNSQLNENGKKPDSPVKTIWDCIDKQHELRKNYYAFIFQDTNLMPNFTAEENVALPEMVDMDGIICQHNKPDCPDYLKPFATKCKLTIENCSIIRARATLARVGIEESLFSKPVKQLSGGQKQRVAFARAINAQYLVVFGDEPTGNLDERSSHDVMETFRKAIQTTDEINGYKNKNLRPASAIIVSHSIDLTLQYADRIIPIDVVEYKLGELSFCEEMKKQNGIVIDNETRNVYGRVDKDKVFVSEERDGKKSWFVSSADGQRMELSTEEMKDKLSRHLNASFK